MSIFSDRLKKAMSIRNIKQNDLCYITGIPKSAMSQYVSGAFNPKQNRTYLIAKALDVSEAWLLGLNVSMERTENIDFELTSHEKAVITAYRNQPAMQEAVDRLLGVQEEEKLVVFQAARSTDNTPPGYTEIPKSVIEKLENAPDFDGDL